MTKKRFILLTGVLSLLAITSICPSQSLLANVADISNGNYTVSEYPLEKDYYSMLDEDGNITYYTAKDVINESESSNGYEIIRIDDKGNRKIIGSEENYEKAKESAAKISNENENQIYAIKEADSNKNQSKSRSSRSSDYVVKLKPLTNALGYAMYANVINTNTNATTGISWSSSWDAAYLRTEGDFYIIKISNVIAKINKADAELLNYSSNLAVGYYQVSDGRFYHYTSTNVDSYTGGVSQIGYKPSYINNNTKYYSYDGKYFYTDYPTMLNDYRNNRFTNAVNSESPFYNYFQYLSHRTKTNFTGEQIDEYVKAIKGSTNYSNSKLNRMGTEFVKNQNIYGSNALLMFGVAVNESGWGLSPISQSKNNLFGHGAVDSNPAYGANGYSSPAESIEEHAKSWVNPYSNPGDWRYNGSLLGSKSSGMNVKYATDQYWGEKAASIAYGIENYYKNQGIDYGRYTIGLIDGDANVYKDTSGSKILYTTGNNSYSINDQSVVILERSTGKEVNGSSVWYKIASDVPLSADRNSLTPDRNYDSNRDYVYIHSTSIKSIAQGDGFITIGLKEEGGYVNGFKLGDTVENVKNILSKHPKGDLVDFKNKAGQSISSGVVSTGMSFSLKENNVINTYNVVIKGDVNGDGKILANDYFIIKKYKENLYKLSDSYIKAADVNNDGKVLANDYFMIKKYKEGQYEIAQ